MRKLANGVVALGFLVGSVFAADSYYIFSGSNVVNWGTGNYVSGYTYGTVTISNPENPYSTGDKDFFNDGVGKIVNASTAASGDNGVFILVDKVNPASGKSIKDCVQGISYWYKGGEHVVNIEYPDTYCTGTTKWNNKWQASATASNSEWTKKIIAVNGFTQVAATGGCDKAVDLSIASKLVWGTEKKGITGYNLMIGNVACLVDGAKDDDVAPTAVDFAWTASQEDICSGYYCNWTSSTGGSTGCGVINTDKSGLGGTVTANCTEAIANCADHSPSKKVYSNATCTTAIVTSSSSTTSSASTASSSSVGGSSSSDGSSSSNSGSSSSVEGSSSSDSDNSSSSEGEETPITNRTTLVASQSQKYYSLKGEPLGNAKPQKAGIYIVKEGSSIKKIAVR